MTPTRLKVLRYFLFKNRNHVSVSELRKFFFDASYHTKADRFIKSNERIGELNRVYFKGYDEPLYYPSDFPVKSLEQVAVESFYPENWHYYEVPETRINESDVVVDCGAAEGLFTFLVKMRCKEIFLIEPVKKFCRSLQKTFENNIRVKIIPVALSEKEGFANISEHDISSSLTVGDQSAESVTVTTLDKLFYEKNIPISYIKMDLEGFDYEALLGAAELIKKNKPKIAVTTYHKFEHAEQISNYLKSIVPAYNIKVKGIYQETGSPVMLHAWI
ncbi:hypothetical protein BH10BAC4_BH10BAC4_08820 [soil metagenome]